MRSIREPQRMRTKRIGSCRLFITQQRNYHAYAFAMNAILSAGSVNNSTSAMEMDWSNDHCIELIDAYKKRDVLWNPKHPFYNSKNKKNDAWNEIAEQMQLDEKTVRQKMNSLLGSFRAQRSKGKRLIGTGKGATEVYNSKWFAFEHMKFLLDKDEPRSTFDCQSDMYELSTMNSPLPFRQTDDEYLEETIDPESVSITESGNNTDSESGPPRFAVKAAERETPRLLLKRRKLSEDPRIGETKRMADDRFDNFGKYIASKMRLYSRTTEITVEHHINEILYQADLGMFDEPIPVAQENNIIV
ncbi:MADF domain-containing protein [Nephila pilipes]|uniref:MADF domain-containing protein n=1 Tax=Nephila pilipes TaxID=299642 RepID=A0A8X6NER5_NEPPI|nr:MADF domain-containing protein [Nephila pilipes]